MTAPKSMILVGDEWILLRDEYEETKRRVDDGRADDKSGLLEFTRHLPATEVTVPASFAPESIEGVQPVIQGIKHGSKVPHLRT